MLSLRSLLLAFVCGAACALLFAFLYFRFIAPPRYFPQLADGSYFTSIVWEDLRGEELPESLLLKTKKTRFIASFPPPQQETLSGSFIELDDGSDGYAPVQLQADSGSYLFFVKSLEDSKFSGRVVEVTSGRQGAWSMQPLPTQAVVSDSEEGIEKNDSETTLHLSLLLEEQYVTSVLEKNQIAVQSIVEKTKGLEGKLTEVDQLREEGKQRLETVNKDLESLQESKEKALKELGHLAQQLQLARNVTKYGEVLRLSRKAQELDEARYLEKEDYLNLQVPAEEEGDYLP